MYFSLFCAFKLTIISFTSVIKNNNHCAKATAVNYSELQSVCQGGGGWSSRQKLSWWCVHRHCLWTQCLYRTLTKQPQLADKSESHRRFFQPAEGTRTETRHNLHPLAFFYLHNIHLHLLNPGENKRTQSKTILNHRRHRSVQIVAHVQIKAWTESTTSLVQKYSVSWRLLIGWTSWCLHWKLVQWLATWMIMVNYIYCTIR